MKKVIIFILISLIIPAGCRKEQDSGPVSEETAVPDESSSPKNSIGRPDSGDPAGIPAPAGIAVHSAAEWNALGFEAYQAGDYSTAANLFKKAILADSSYLFAHYNLACMLALLYGQGEQVSADEIFSELKICLALDPGTVGKPEEWMLEKLKTDSDLDSLRDLPGFRELPQYHFSHYLQAPLSRLSTNWNAVKPNDFNGILETDLGPDNIYRCLMYHDSSWDSVDYDGMNNGSGSYHLVDDNDSLIHYSISTDGELGPEAFPVLAEAGDSPMSFDKKTLELVVNWSFTIAEGCFQPYEHFYPDLASIVTGNNSRTPADITHSAFYFRLYSLHPSQLEESVTDVFNAVIDRSNPAEIRLALGWPGFDPGNNSLEQEARAQCGLGPEAVESEASGLTFEIERKIL